MSNGGSAGTGGDWAAQRTEAAAIQAQRLAARQNAEHERAEALLASFLPVVTTRGPKPVDLIVQGYGGQGTARSKLRGWYLRNNRTCALGTDGKFYVLIAPLNRFHPSWLKVDVQPTRPPLIIGEGGKDGDTIDLAEALERILPGWLGGRS